MEISVTSLNVDAALLDSVTQFAESAGELIMDVYRSGSGFVSHKKADDSPVTQADIVAHRYLLKQLSRLTPDIPILSEEGILPDFELRQQWQYYWLIDPLDGTKEFVSGNGEFTVNVALIYKNKPILGVVYAPVLKTLYKAINQGLGQDCAMKVDLGGDRKTPYSEQIISTENIDQRVGQEVRVMVSRHHGFGLVQALCSKIQEHAGSIITTPQGSSLKLCFVAEGVADLYPRFGPTSEWDTAAGQAIVEAAGGSVITTELSVLAYNQKECILNPSFYVVGDKVSDTATASTVLKNWLSVLGSFAGSLS